MKKNTPQLAQFLRKYYVWLFVAAVVIFNFYNARQIFFFRYDPEYFENYYYHSQYNYPGSARGISDGNLYQFVGYRLVQGENPFNLNYEIPPFGKYLYGLSEKFLNNPYWISVIYYLLSFVVVYKLCVILFTNKKNTAFILLILATTPYIATQLRDSMLDLPLMVLFSLHLLFFTYFLSNRKPVTLLLAGMILGLATGTKPGVFTPLSLIFGNVILVGYTLKRLSPRKQERFFPKNRFWLVARVYQLLSVPAIYTLSIIAGYVVSYFSYFLKHPNPIPWLRLHEKIIAFYFNPHSQIYYLNVWKSIFLNKYYAWWGGGNMSLGDWSPLLPLGVVAVMVVLWKSLRKQDFPWIYTCLLAVVFLIMNMFIPFYPRYLLPVIPLLILVFAKAVEKRKLILLLLAFINIPFLLSSIVDKGPAGNAEAVVRFTKTHAYRELYRSIAPSQINAISETEFIETNERFYQQLKIHNLSITLDNPSVVDGNYYYPALISYESEYGKLQNPTTFIFKKINNQWRISWNWDYLYPGFSPSSLIIVEEDKIPLAAITYKGKIVARRALWRSVHMIPRLMFDWTKNLYDLADATGQSTLEVDQVIKSFIPDTYPRYIGYLNVTYSKSQMELLSALPGVSLMDSWYVLPAPDSDLKTVVPLVTKTYKEHPEYFKVAANAYLIKTDGLKRAIDFPVSDRKDIVINY